MCPIRALRFYLDRTKTLRNKRRRLFLPCKEASTSEISKNTIASWIRKVILLAYKDADQETVYTRFSPHEVRALS